ncbi:hypothetical protein QMT40_001770 [Parvibaculaceae bacterium PLY_AMNH_Bact1]|nr:hypothetical protein QMT40_001770 [Parvibaculaceae bacterium PLY_AMNH_Bact1]
MTKPSTAVRLALTELNENETLVIEDVVDRAVVHLGKDEKFYREDFLRAALRRKVKDALRSWHLRETQDEPGEVDLLGQFHNRRVPVKQKDGLFGYRVFDALTWADLKALYDSAKSRNEVTATELETLEDVIRAVSPVMALDDDVTVEEAVKRLAGH